MEHQQRNRVVCKAMWANQAGQINGKPVIKKSISEVHHVQGLLHKEVVAIRSTMHDGLMQNQIAQLNLRSLINGLARINEQGWQTFSLIT